MQGSFYYSNGRKPIQMIHPQRDLVLIQADEADTKTKSGLLLHENWKTIPLTGKILAVGPDVTNIKVGDNVGFNRYASEIMEDNQRLVKQREIKWVF